MVYGIALTGEHKGELTPCRAKDPETCRYHKPGSHVELTDEEYHRKQEEYSSRKCSQRVLRKAPTPLMLRRCMPTPAIIQSPGGGTIDKKAFLNNVSTISSYLSDNDYERLRDISSDLAEQIRKYRFLRDPDLDDKNEKIIAKINEYIRSSTKDAAALRRFLGAGMSKEELSELIDDLSTLIVENVGAMTAKVKYGEYSRSTRRCLFSRVDNDMSKKAYIASVLFFGGRCCYCGRLLKKCKSKNPKDLPPYAATGEHITPLITMENGHRRFDESSRKYAPGTTRFGNVALCCHACNEDRGSLPLDKWVEQTSCIQEEDKPMVLDRIAEFRRMAKYEEMSSEKSKALWAADDKLYKYAKHHSYDEINVEVDREVEAIQAAFPSKTHATKVAVRQR